MKIVFLLLLLMATASIGTWWWILWADTTSYSQRITSVLSRPSTISPASSILPPQRPSPTPQPTNTATQSILFDVPFTPQAPTGNWNDPVYQNACEETSILMTMRWVKGESLTAQEALSEIRALSDYARKNYGHFHDLSTANTARLIKDYYGYSSITVKQDITANDIKHSLAQGKLIIVPVNGRKLPNPFYAPPGPLEHMLVIKGYDSIT